MLKSAYTIAAALIAAGIVALPSLSPRVEARAPVLSAKGDRLDARPLGMACSQREWPYFEAACLRDAKNPSAAMRQARIVAADRLPQLSERR